MLCKQHKERQQQQQQLLVRIFFDPFKSQLEQEKKSGLFDYDDDVCLVVARTENRMKSEVGKETTERKGDDGMESQPNSLLLSDLSLLISFTTANVNSEWLLFLLVDSVVVIIIRPPFCVLCGFR